MELTRLSSQALRAAHHWEAGQELMAIDVGDGILLKPKKPFPETTLYCERLKTLHLPKTLISFRYRVLSRSKNV